MKSLNYTAGKGTPWAMIGVIVIVVVVLVVVFVVYRSNSDTGDTLNKKQQQEIADLLDQPQSESLTDEETEALTTTFEGKSDTSLTPEEQQSISDLLTQ